MTEPAEEPPASRWEVLEEKGPPAGGLYELEITTRYRVVSRRTGREVLSFEGLYEASFVDGGWSDARTSGVVHVAISEDDRHARVSYADGSVVEVALPCTPGAEGSGPGPDLC